MAETANLTLDLQKEVASVSDAGGPLYSQRDVRLRVVRKHAVAASVMAGDVFMLALAFGTSLWSAYVINVDLFGRDYQLIGDSVQLMLRAGDYALLSAGFIFWVGGHRGYHQRQPFWAEARQIFLAMLCLVLIDSFLRYATKEQFSRLWLVQNWAFAGVFLLFGRQLVTAMLDRAGLWRISTLVVGSPQRGREVAAALRSEAYLGYDVVGVADVEAGRFLPAGSAWGETASANVGKPLRGDVWGMLVGLCREHGVSHIVLALGEGGLVHHRALIRRLTSAGISFAVAPPLEGVAVDGLQVQSFFSHDLVLLKPRNNLDRPFDKALKRGVDIAASALGLILLGPLLLLIALLVRLDGGPALFGHCRIGMKGRPFHCLKFRSMVPNAEEMLQELQADDAEMAAEWARDVKLRDDPRITRLGSFLRKSSIDELPQLINVLRGDMSLVGPRPIVEAELQYYGDEAPFYLEVRPGITGLWQVSGRNNAGYERRVTLDAWYFRNWSLWHDIAIICRTVPAVLKQEGAC